MALILSRTYHRAAGETLDTHFYDRSNGRRYNDLISVRHLWHGAITSRASFTVSRQ
ncbi:MULTISPECIES: hypothetical protein [unclassified Rhodococcus (in: high G+C Gram-positive bacteria)]|uniref:hypothetical protein n=1 Tax=unclassified Rhodococcus (in: high G+C Gram-positive bacteria) TaxID=192944 RepID=UPI000ABEFB87|nr:MULTISPECIES: hypothetical protein [unclassified Rhodococcus (in: high G+C Gram-positive bacteria)]